MKKIFALMIMGAALFCSQVGPNPPFEMSAATVSKTVKKKAPAKKSTARAIGSFKADGMTITLLSNGKIRTSQRCVTGEYKKLDGYIKVDLWTRDASTCGDGGWQFVIVGKDVYYLYSGSDNCMCEYTVDAKNRTLTKTDYDPESDPDFFGMDSATVPLSTFDKIGTYRTK